MFVFFAITKFVGCFLCLSKFYFILYAKADVRHLMIFMAYSFEKQFPDYFCLHILLRDLVKRGKANGTAAPTANSKIK